METKLRTQSLNLYYGKFHALKDVNIQIKPQAITAIIGPSGCGKSTLLRCFNRMNELIRDVRIEGGIFLDGMDINAPGVDLTRLRRRVGMVFQRPNPFPLSIADNVSYGLRVHGAPPGTRVSEVVEQGLRATHLWDEVKDKLNSPEIIASVPNMVLSVLDDIQTDLTLAQIRQLICLLPKLSRENLQFVRFPDEWMVQGRADIARLGNTFVWDIPVEKIVEFINAFENDTLPVVLEEGGTTCPVNPPKK